MEIDFLVKDFDWNVSFFFFGFIAGLHVGAAVACPPRHL